MIRGVGVGGCINALDEHFSYVTEHVHVAHAVCDHQGGGGGCINVLDEHFPYVAEPVAVVDLVHMLSDALLLDFLREPILPPRIIPTKDSRWPKSTTNKISLLRHHLRGRLRGKSYRTSVAGTQQIDGTWKHLRKWRPMSMLHKKKQQVYKKRYTCSYSWTWRHNAALLQSLASVLPQALWY